MKKFLLSSFLFFINFIFAQNIAIDIDLSDLEKTKFEKAIIHFNDGTSLEGIGRLKTIFTSKEEVIIFKIEDKDKDETWTVKDAIGITIITDDGVQDYEYLKVSKNSFAELYEVVNEGTVKLYKKIKTSKNPIKFVLPTILANYPGVTNNPIQNGGRNSSFDQQRPENVIYYMKKETELYPTKVRDNYIKSIAEYMKDCEFMVEKIKKHTYNYNQLKDLVDYYNANCGLD